MFLITFYFLHFFFYYLIFLQEYCKKWIERYHETGGVENKLKCGTLRITAEEEDKSIVNSIKQNPKYTSIKIKKNLGLANYNNSQKIKCCGIQKSNRCHKNQFKKTPQTAKSWVCIRIFEKG